jgi:hypothetical protein
MRRKASLMSVIFPSVVKKMMPTVSISKVRRQRSWLACRACSASSGLVMSVSVQPSA